MDFDKLNFFSLKTTFLPIENKKESSINDTKVLEGRIGIQDFVTLVLISYY
jgi:hypothetical protein